VVVGHGNDLPELRQFCDRLGIAHAVRFTDRIPDSDLADEYRYAHLFVLPSVADPDASPPIGEGFGLVFAEAGAFGLPSVGSTVGGGSLEIVVDGETGINVPPHDHEALVETIMRLVDDSALRSRLGEAARRRVTSRHVVSHFESSLENACPPER